MTNNQIVADIINHASSEGSGYKNWYCGIAADVHQRLHSDHNVPQGQNVAWWIKRNASSEVDARDTERYLLSLGFDGDTGGGDYQTVYVYAYKKIPGITKER